MAFRKTLILSLAGAAALASPIAAFAKSFDGPMPGQQLAPGVPEPATWAMMLIGFGLIGAFMRLARRRKAAVA